jgi:tetratricopeptide (TPR) repeat protein
MQKTRHQLFQQMALALSHQQNGNAELALAYWENVLRLAPAELRIHNEILEEGARIAKEHNTDRIWQKVDALTKIYHQEFTEEDRLLFQYVYRAMSQQCSGNHVLAFAYWKNAVATLTSDSLVVTLGVQDFCWTAHQYLKAGNLKHCIDVYAQLIQTFPEFLEGYINLSIIKYKYGYTTEAVPILKKIPPRFREEFVVVRYRDLYEQISEISRQFDHVPYAAIEEIVNDLRIENTFYPSIADEYFTEFISDLVNREKRFFEKRRKVLEEKAIAKTSARLAQEGIALGQRVTLAKQAKREDIPEFLYDSDVRIAEALLNNPNTTREDVLVMAQTACVSEILTLIAENKKWGTLHSIVMAILLNPQTLPQDAIRLLDLLSINDLARVFYKKVIPTEVRMRAKLKIQQIFNTLSLYEKAAAIEVSAGNIFKFLDDVQLDLPSFLANLVKKFPVQPEIIVNISRWKLTPVNILTIIGTKPQFTSNIQIKFALLSNPRTPEEVVISLVQSLEEKDAEYVLLNKHIPSSVKHTISTCFPNMSA